MARIGRHKRVGPYKGGMGKASSYLRTTVSYDFDDKEIMHLHYDTFRYAVFHIAHMPNGRRDRYDYISRYEVQQHCGIYGSICRSCKMPCGK